MVTPVDPSQALARLAALMAQRQRGAPHAGNGGAPSGAAPATLQQRLQAIGQDHPRRQRALSRVLIEDMLSREFSDATVLDAGFQDIVDQVLDALEQSPAFEADLARATAALHSPSPPQL